MRTLLVKAFLLLAINAGLGFGIQAAVNARLHFELWETDSVLLTAPRNTDFDFLIMGTSRAKPLTRIQCNCETMKRELGERLYSVALPFGGGIVPAKLMLQSFFDRGNRAKTILYFIDPFVFFTDGINRFHRFVYYEPLDLRLLFRMPFNRIPPERIITYINSKFRYDWFFQKPGLVPCYHEPIHDTEPDQAKIKARIDSLYTDGLDESTFRHYAPELGKILDIGTRHGCRFVFVIAPTLLGDEPGKDRMLDLLEIYRRRYGFRVCDFNNAIPDLNLYSDYDHLNSDGVERFVKEFLKPAEPPQL